MDSDAPLRWPMGIKYGTKRRLFGVDGLQKSPMQ
ncbi:hypothetical protein MnTg02_00340 [bacterium MnTg02]|nr:hypothetical protein MnTg02_00340 [bacterium MnTg02]